MKNNRVKAVVITDLHELSSHTLFHVSECSGADEIDLFACVMCAKAPVKIGSFIADPLF